MSEELSDFLDDEPVETEVEAAPETEEVEVEAETEEPAEEIEKGEEVAEVSPTPEKTPEQTVPLAALREERLKRQELSRQLEEMQKAQPAETPVDLLDDPDKWAAQQRAQVEQLESKFEQQRLADKFAMSESMAKASHADYDEVTEYFHRAAEQNPSLIQELRQQAHPAEYAYNAGKNLMVLAKGGGSLDAVIEQTRKEAYEQAKAELLAQQPKADAPPPTLTKQSGVTRTEEVVDDDDFTFLPNKF